MFVELVCPRSSHCKNSILKKGKKKKLAGCCDVMRFRICALQISDLSDRVSDLRALRNYLRNPATFSSMFWKHLFKSSLCKSHCSHLLRASQFKPHLPSTICINLELISLRRSGKSANLIKNLISSLNPEWIYLSIYHRGIFIVINYIV